MRFPSPLRGHGPPQTPPQRRHRRCFHPAVFLGFRIGFPPESRRASDIAGRKQKARGLFRVFREAVGSPVGDGEAGPRTLHARNPKRRPTRNFLRFSKQHLRVCEQSDCLCRMAPERGSGTVWTARLYPAPMAAPSKNRRHRVPIFRKMDTIRSLQGVLPDSGGAVARLGSRTFPGWRVSAGAARWETNCRVQSS